VRVVSLVPSVTETLSAWGVEPIACTRFCERPDLPHVGGTKNPDLAAIVALRPDLVVLDRQENRREDADALTGAGLRLLALDVRSLDGLPDELTRLAIAVGLGPPDLATDAVLAGLLPLSVAAFVPIWRRPWMTIGPDTFGSSLLASIGVTNVFADSTDDYPSVTLDSVGERHPDIVLVPSEPYSFDDAHLDELRSVAPTVRVDGQDLFWWGARTPPALARLHADLERRLGVPAATSSPPDVPSV
jgi:ABC-type Fe3+-hydroxamate transport system substrate-binding protein